MIPKKIVDRIMGKITQEAIVRVERLGTEDIARLKAELKNKNATVLHDPAEQEPYPKKSKLNDCRDDTPNCLVDESAINQASYSTNDRPSTKDSDSLIGKIRIHDVRTLMTDEMSKRFNIVFSDIVTKPFANEAVSYKRKSLASPVLLPNPTSSVRTRSQPTAEFTREAIVLVERLSTADIARLKAELKKKDAAFFQDSTEQEPGPKNPKPDDDIDATFFQDPNEQEPGPKNPKPDDDIDAAFFQDPNEQEPGPKKPKPNDSRDNTLNCLVDECSIEQESDSTKDRPSTKDSDSLIGKIRVRDVRTMMTDEMFERFNIMFTSENIAHVSKPFANEVTSDKRKSLAIPLRLPISTNVWLSTNSGHNLQPSQIPIPLNGHYNDYSFHSNQNTSIASKTTASELPMRTQPTAAVNDGRVQALKQIVYTLIDGVAVPVTPANGQIQDGEITIENKQHRLVRMHPSTVTSDDSGERRTYLHRFPPNAEPNGQPGLGLVRETHEHSEQTNNENAL